jgi:hypothetical protein
MRITIKPQRPRGLYKEAVEKYKIFGLLLFVAPEGLLENMQKLTQNSKKRASKTVINSLS